MNWRTICAGIAVAGLLAAGCGRRTAVELAGDRVPRGWTVQIVDVAEPDSVIVLRRDMTLGTVARIPGPPDESDKKWVVVKLTVTPPAPDDAREILAIGLLNPGGDGYSAEAIGNGATGRANGAELPEFVYRFDNPQVLKDASGRMALLIESGFVKFPNAGPQEMSVLFAVPKSAASLKLVL